ncbi:unnamed protein product [Sphagnum troendelagicum]|uniref:Phosphoglycerate mutase n=1 Tax=Sphagnum troendelagicum TaxID=128251 RepID=A0ABP0UEH0_9BRYO
MAGLKNKYYVLRHGRSIPNEEGLIVSLMSNGVLPMYGLAPSGVLQAQAAGMTLAKELEGLSISPDCVSIYASPFSRTTQTAQAVADVLESSLGTKPSIQLMEELRERYFGPSLELQSHEHYPEIWAIDALDPMVGPEGGESVADVAHRVSQAILSIESELEGCVVLIVSHGDTLQILQTVVHAALLNLATMGCGSNTLSSTHLNGAICTPVLSQHRNFALLTGELRQLT